MTGLHVQTTLRKPNLNSVVKSIGNNDWELVFRATSSVWLPLQMNRLCTLPNCKSLWIKASGQMELNVKCNCNYNKLLLQKQQEWEHHVIVFRESYMRIYIFFMYFWDFACATWIIYSNNYLCNLIFSKTDESLLTLSQSSKSARAPLLHKYFNIIYNFWLIFSEGRGGNTKACAWAGTSWGFLQPSMFDQ